MKKIGIVFALLVSAIGYSQIDVVSAEGLQLDVQTSILLNGLASPSEGLLVGNTTTKSLWYYNGTEFIDLMAAVGGLTDAQISTAFLNINPNTDLNGGDDFSGNYADLINIPADILDGDNDTIADGSETKVSAGTNVTITGNGTTATPYIFDVPNAIMDYSQPVNSNLLPSTTIISLGSSGAKFESAWLKFLYVDRNVSTNEIWLNGLAAEPGDNLGNGVIYYNSLTHQFLGRANGSFVDLGSVGSGTVTADERATWNNAKKGAINQVLTTTPFATLSPSGEYEFSGADIGRPIIVTANNQIINRYVEEAHEVGAIRRFETWGTGKFNLMPTGSQVFEYDGKTTLPGVTFEGNNNKGYLKKKAANVWVFEGKSFSGYNSVVNLFPTGSAVSPTPDEANSKGTFTDNVLTYVTATYKTNGLYGYMAANANNAGFNRANIDITGLPSGVTKTFTIDVNQIQGTSGRIYICDVNTNTTMTGVTTGANPTELSDTPGFNTLTFTIPSTVTGFRLSIMTVAAVPNNNDGIIDAGEEWIGVDNGNVIAN